ncbi:CinA family nicotinamide mononucleotide deamidase-related protein [Saccharicrinis sp. FJH54]|uniref:CinA family nicotinamide mononucleotide deamidase-related protein n=1 Tax=Saccharicrinis sp. FJH54 TaxID=3344665 RepID=UPI0035D42D91
MIKVHIITIGDELLIGQVIDTNSAWMGEYLSREGFEVAGKQSVKDDRNAITTALDFALLHSDIVLITGGLGPTKDDITVKVLASYFNSGFIFNDEVLKNVERIILPRIGHINAHNRSQAEVPEKARIIMNSLGTAPILWFEEHGKVVVSMPGVPYEMKHAMTQDVVPQLIDKFKLQNLNKYKTIVVSGITEAELAENLAEFENALPESIRLAYLPSPGYIKLRLTGKNAGPAYDTYLNRLKHEVRSILVSEDEILPEWILAGLISDKNLTVATAESCTGGLIAHKITSVPGSSKYFKGSVVAYDNAVKIDLLDVPEELLEQYGAVSEEVVIAMALGVSRRLKTEIGIATSGIAGPDGGTPEKPVGTIWLGWCIKGDCFAKKLSLHYTRQVNIERTATNALMALNKYLKDM